MIIWEYTCSLGDKWFCGKSLNIMNNYTINLNYSKYDTRIYLKRKEEGYIYVAVQFP